VGQRWEATLSATGDVLEDSTFLQFWEVAGQAGQTVTIEVMSEAFDAVVLVAGPGLKATLSDDDSGGLCNALLVVQFPATGRYRVGVTANGPKTGGRYVLSVTPGRAAPVDLGCDRDG